MSLKETFSKRRLRILEASEQAGCHCVVIYSSAHHSLLGMDGVWWSTGFRPMGESAVGIAPDGSATLWTAPRWDVTRARETADGMTVDAPDELFSAMASWLHQLDIPVGKLLLCGQAKLGARRQLVAEEALGAGWVDGDRHLVLAGRLRDERERYLAKKATMVAETAHLRLLEELRPGLDEYGAVAILEALLRELGSQDNFILVSASQRNRSVHPPTDRVIERGDVLLAEISPSCEGVFTQICRSVTIGRSASPVADDYGLLMGALEAGLAACVPGAPVKAAAGAMDSVLTDAGFGDYCRPPYMRARGHGLGLGSILPGDVSARSEETFCEGDYFVLHPNQYLPTSGYLLCGEPVFVEANGARPLSSSLGALESVAT